MLVGSLMIAIGLLLILLEFFLPGGIMGVAGGVVFILGLVAFALNSPHLWLTLTVVAVSIALLLILIRITLKRLQRSKRESSIYLHSDQEGYRASSFSQEMVGKSGTVKADLKPAGHIQVEGKLYQALSRAGYLAQGTPITIIGGQGAHLIVKEKTP